MSSGFEFTLFRNTSIIWVMTRGRLYSSSKFTLVFFCMQKVSFSDLCLRGLGKCYVFAGQELVKELSRVPLSASRKHIIKRCFLKVI